MLPAREELEVRLRSEEAAVQALRLELDAARRTCVVRQVRDMQAEIDRLRKSRELPEGAAEVHQLRRARAELVAAQEDAGSVRSQLEEQRRSHRAEQTRHEADLQITAQLRQEVRALRAAIAQAEETERLHAEGDELQQQQQAVRMQSLQASERARCDGFEREAHEAEGRLRLAESDLRATRAWVERSLDAVEDQRCQLERHSQAAVRCLREENHALRKEEGQLGACLGELELHSARQEESAAREVAALRLEIEGAQGKFEDLSEAAVQQHEELRCQTLEVDAREAALQELQQQVESEAFQAAKIDRSRILVLEMELQHASEAWNARETQVQGEVHGLLDRLEHRVEVERHLYCASEAVQAEMACRCIEAEEQMEEAGHEADCARKEHALVLEELLQERELRVSRSAFVDDRVEEVKAQMLAMGRNLADFHQRLAAASLHLGTRS